MLAKAAGTTDGKVLDPRVKRTRGLLVRAFNELLAEKGHSSLTVQEIAERATVNRATFYAHFRDQYELFDHVISEAFWDELRIRLPGSPGMDEETLKALVLASCHYLASLNTACSRTDQRFKPLIEARVQKELYGLLLGWIPTSSHAKDDDFASPEVVASVVSWAIFGAGLQWSRDRSAPPADETARQVLSVILHGLEDHLLSPGHKP